MNPPIAALSFAIVLFVGMVIMLEVGRRLGLRRHGTESEGERGGLGTVEGAVFALFGLLMAFSFSGAATRFNEKRMLIAEEVSAVETTYQQLDLVPAGPRAHLQDLMRQYVDSRLETYQKLSHIQAAEAEMARSIALREEIWSGAEAATRLPDAHVDAGKLL